MKRILSFALVLFAVLLFASRPLVAAEAVKPPAGHVRFSHFVKVDSVSRVSALADALALDHLHAWAPELVAQRFHYRAPGLYVLRVRAFRLPEPVQVIERPGYAGCKTWVPLDAPVRTDGATEVARG